MVEKGPVGLEGEPNVQVLNCPFSQCERCCSTMVIGWDWDSPNCKTMVIKTCRTVGL